MLLYTKIKLALILLKSSFQRAKRGWSDMDASHIEYYLEEILPGMLKRRESFPYIPILVDEKEWNDILKKMRKNILLCNEDFAEKVYRKRHNIPEDKILSSHDWDMICACMNKAKERFCELLRKNFFKL